VFVFLVVILVVILIDFFVGITGGHFVPKLAYATDSLLT